MKTMKKALTVVLALMILMSLSIAVFAAQTPTYTINVTNDTAASHASIKGQTYTAYQVFKLTYPGYDAGSGAPSGEGEIPYSYAISDALKDWEYCPDPDGTPTVTYKNEKLIEYIAGLSETGRDAKLQHFAQAAIAKLKDAETDGVVKAPGTGADAPEGSTVETAAITVPAAGYYVIEGTALSSNGSGNNSLTSICSLTSAKPTAEIRAKVEAPVVTKTVGDKTQVPAEIGETVSFKVETTVPNMTGFKGYQMQFDDTMSAGLTIPTAAINTDDHDTIILKVGDKKLKLEDKNTGPVEKGAALTDTYDAFLWIENNKIHVMIPDLQAYCKAKNVSAGTKITLTYDALVNNKAMTTSDVPEKNTVTLSYTNNPTTKTDWAKTPPQIVKLYNFGLDVLKYTGGSTANKLADAEFMLFKAKVTEGGAQAEDADVIANAGTITKEYYTYSSTANSGDGSVTWGPKDSATIKTTQLSDGKFADGPFVGLVPGTYYLEETKEPAGYALLKHPIKVEISEYDKPKKDHEFDGATYKIYEWHESTGKEDTAEYKQVGADNNVDFAQDMDFVVNVENKSGSVLPETGGIGTTIFYTVGAIMMASALVLLITKKKMSAK